MNVPKLRFNEFIDEWNCCNLSNLYSFKNGINGDKSMYGKGIKYISVGDILNNNFITYERIKGLINIDEKTLNANRVEYGDLLFQRSSETRSEIGTTNVYLDNNRTATFGGFVIRGKKENENNPLFMNYLLKTQKARKEIVFRGAGAQHYNIGQEDLKQVKIFIPSKNEQLKIADMVQLLDKKIELQSRKIEALKLYKIYVRDNIITNNEYHECKLKDILTKWNLKNKNNEYSYVESVNNRFGFISQNEQFEDRNVASSDKSNYYIIKKNIFAYNPSRLDVGSLALKKNDKISLVSPLYECFTTTQNMDYMLEWFNSKYFRKETFSKFEGGVRNTLNFSNLSTIKIKLPTLEKQKNISTILLTINKKIELENNRIAYLINLKKGLMQSMFV